MLDLTIRTGQLPGEVDRLPGVHVLWFFDPGDLDGRRFIVITIILLGSAPSQRSREQQSRDDLDTTHLLT